MARVFEIITFWMTLNLGIGAYFRGGLILEFRDIVQLTGSHRQKRQFFKRPKLCQDIFQMVFLDLYLL